MFQSSRKIVVRSALMTVFSTVLFSPVYGQCPDQTGQTKTSCSGSSQIVGCRCVLQTQPGTPPATPIYTQLPANGQCVNFGRYTCTASVVSPGEECEAAKGLAIAPDCTPKTSCKNNGVKIIPVVPTPYTNSQGKTCCDVTKKQTCVPKPPAPGGTAACYKDPLLESDINLDLITPESHVN